MTEWDTNQHKEGLSEYARSRGITVQLGRAEQLQFESEHFDFAMMITTLCFLDNPRATLQEACRILKLNGSIIICRFICNQNQRRTIV